MGRKLHYRPASFYRVDDRTGFPERAERTQKEWDGGIVDEARWEARHPQDFVRGVRDIQSVDEARPLAPAVFVGPTSTTISARVFAGSTGVFVDDPSWFGPGASVGVMLETGVVWPALVTAIVGLEVFIGTPLPYPAAAGSLLIVYSAGTANAPAAFLVTEAGQFITTEDGQDLF